MKFVDEVSPEKLRGGFYTPPQLVAECFGRVAELLGNDRALDILEPSAGDGAFVRGVSPAVRGALIRKPRFTCVEILHEEAAKCRDALRSAHLKGEVIDGSFFSWARGQLPSFDALVGNPPFVRYQFVPRSQRDDANWIFGGRGQVLDGVANLWIPFLLISLELLRSQGAFAMVLPSELFATKSAGVVRSELIRHIDDLQIDLHPRGSFPRILQDTIVLSGRRCEVTGTERVVKFVEHSRRLRPFERNL